MCTRSRFQQEELAQGCLVRLRGVIDDERLEKLDTIAECVDDLEVLVDHRVEQRVEQQPGGREKTVAEALLHREPRRELLAVDRDDRVL